MSVVCLEEFRAERGRPRTAERPAEPSTDIRRLEPADLMAHLPGPYHRTLTPRQVQHRWRMLAHLRMAR